MICPNVPHNLTDYFERAYWPRQLGRSQQTRVLYKLTLARFAEYLGRSPNRDDLTDECVCGFLQWRLANNRAKQTVDKERDKLLALANYAARKRHIPEFLDVPQIPLPQEIPQCWRREHLTMLLRACRDTCGKIGNAPACDWWLAFHNFIIYTGERTGATLAIEWDWLDGSTIRVPASARKGGKTAMAYQLPPIVVSSIAKLRGVTEKYIFEIPWARGYHSGTFYRQYERLLKRAGLPSGRAWKPQCLRRTFASYLEAGGGDATAALAHSDRKTTVRSYLDPGITDAGKESAGEIVARGLAFG
jgi:integrase